MERRPTRYGNRADTELVVVLDCVDPDRAAEFWCAALGYVDPVGPGGPGPYRPLVPADGAGVELLLQEVAEPHTTKNRMHLDLRVHDLDAEVARLVALGARYVVPGRIEENGWVWYVLADPDGNEFCVLAPPAEHWEHARG